MRLIGLYKTTEAARKAKAMMREQGIPDERTSLLAPDDTRGPHLAAFAHHAAGRYAWLGGALAAAFGALILGVSTTAEITWVNDHPFTAGHWASALWGAALAFPLGAVVGAVFGWRKPTLRADFFEADEDRGGTALGVIARTAEEAEAARYAFRSTGALQVRSGKPVAARPAAPSPVAPAQR